MNRTKLQNAVDEAERFLTKVKALPQPQPYPEDSHMKGYFMDYFPKEQGAIKRASMDLSRALTELRNPK